MKNDEFHIPFLHSLVIVAVVTVVSMVSAHFFIHNSFSTPYDSPQYTSSGSYSEAKAGE